MKSHKILPFNSTIKINPSHNPITPVINKINNHGQIYEWNKSKKNIKHHLIAKSPPTMDSIKKTDKSIPNHKITPLHPTAMHYETPSPPQTSPKNNTVLHPILPSNSQNKITIESYPLINKILISNKIQTF
jgi:hypothetical protein